MGLLSEGSPLSWEETKQLSKYVRDHGIQQFINLYKKLEKKSDSIYSDGSDQSAINNCDSLKWGDEVSCHFPFA